MCVGEQQSCRNTAAQWIITALQGHQIWRTLTAHGVGKVNSWRRDTVGNCLYSYFLRCKVFWLSSNVTSDFSIPFLARWLCFLAEGEVRPAISDKQKSLVTWWNLIKWSYFTNVTETITLSVLLFIKVKSTFTLLEKSQKYRLSQNYRVKY